ncbi:MAG: leucine-rich repeat protein [Lachnospiraceae bacterium]
MKRKKYVVILACIVASITLTSSALLKNKETDNTKSYSAEVNDTVTAEKNENVVTAEIEPEVQKMSLDSFGDEQEEKIEVVETKQFVAEEPKEEYTLSKGNAQNNTIVHKDLSDLEDSYLYNVNKYSLSTADLESEGLYGYNSYADNKNAQLYYKAIDSAMKSFVNENSDVTKQGEYYLLSILDYTEYGITQEDAVNIYYIYKHDHPLYYWLSATVILYSNGMGILTDEEYATAQIRNEYDEQIQQCIDGFISDTADMNQDEKVRYVHDTIIKNTDYAYEEDGITPQDANWAHNIIGYICNQGVVCEGYAKMFQVVLNELGINTIFVTGISQGEEHAWNLVQMSDNNWYWMDLTWDDEPDWNEDGVSDIYFCCPKSLFSDTHTEYTVSGTDGNYLYDLPEVSDSYTYYCASTDNILSVSEPADIIDEVVDKTKVEINKENNCVIFKVDDTVKTPFLNTLFSGYQKVDNEIIYYYQMFMDSLPDTVGKVSDIRYRLVGDNYYVYFQPQDDVKAIVKVKKNKKEIGNYSTLTEAFSAMTDSTADYQIQLINATEALIFPMKTPLPDVNSVSVTGCKIPVGSSYAVTSFFLPEDLYISQDFCVEDLYIGGMLFNNDTIVKIGAADFTVSGDYFSIGTFSLSTALGMSKNSISLQGDEGSNFVVDGATVELNVPASFDKVTLKNGTLNVRGSEYNFGTLEMHNSSRLSPVNINAIIEINIGDILASDISHLGSGCGEYTVNISGDIYCNLLCLDLGYGYGSSHTYILGEVYGSLSLYYEMYNVAWSEYESVFADSCLYVPKAEIVEMDLFFGNTVSEFQEDEYRLQKDEDGNIFVEKYDNKTYESGNYVYRKLSDGTCELLEESNGKKLLTVPAEIDGYPVSKIDRMAFYGKSEYECDTDSEYFVVEDDVLYSKDKKILYRYSDSKYNEKYTIMDGVEVIKADAFANPYIKEISISSSVKEIETKTYFDCLCKSLECITVAKDNPYYSSLDGVLFDKNLETLLFYPYNKKDLIYETPDTVTKIAERAVNNKNIVCFKVNENCQYIVGDRTFFHTDNLTQLYLPDSLKYIASAPGEATIYAPSYKVAYEYAVAHGRPFVLTSGEFSSPVNLIVQTNFSMVQLEWDRSNYASKYQIYRKKSGDTTYELLTVVSDMSYLDVSVDVGEEYSYYVVAVRNDQEEIVYSEPSEEVSIVVSDKVILDDDGYDMQGIAYLLDEKNKTAQVGLVGTCNTSRYEGYNNGKVAIPASVESNGVEYQVVRIGDYAFYENRELKEIAISDSIVSIGEMAFRRSGLSGNAEISEYVEDIGIAAFSEIYSLDNIFVSEENQQYSSEDGVLFSKDKKTLICYPCGRSFNTGITSCIVPDTVTEIGAYAFCGLLYSKIYLPDTVEVIGDSAFSISNITDITLPNVVEIGESAFNGCRELVNVNLGDKLELMSDQCFQGCEKLKGIYIPDSVRRVGTKAFDQCVSLEYVVGCKNTEFGDCYLFSTCYDLKLIMLPEQIEKLPDIMISNCSSLEKLYLPETVTELPDGCLLGASENLVLYSKTGTAVESYAQEKLLEFQNVEEHEHCLEWEVLEEETDVGRGLSVHKCRICNYVAEVSATQVIEHNISTEWTIDKEPTCTSEGEKSHHCTREGCEYRKDITTIDSLGHTWSEEYTVTKEPTCTEAGVRKYKCIVEGCKEVKKEEIPALGHEMSDEWTIDKEATCISRGEKSHHCTRKDCAYRTDITAIEKSDHTWSTEYTVTKEPTSTEPGVREYKCIVEGCTATKEEEISVLGHEISDEWTIDKKPTCTSEGEKSHHCTKEVCDYREDITVIAKTDHTWSSEYTVDRYPTETEDGTKSIHCVVCDVIKDGSNVVIPKLISDKTDGTTETSDKEETTTETKEELPAVGTKKTVTSGTYKVTKSSSKKKEVVFVKPKSSKKTTVTIPSTVNMNGQTYKVTEVASQAFMNNKKIKSVTIGKNVTKIGKEAFSGCKNLKTITIKSTTLKSVEKNAIKNINNKAVIKVPKKQLKKYKKLLNSKSGYKKSMRVK